MIFSLFSMMSMFLYNQNEKYNIYFEFLLYYTRAGLKVCTSIVSFSLRLAFVWYFVLFCFKQAFFTSERGFVTATTTNPVAFSDMYQLLQFLCC